MKWFNFFKKRQLLPTNYDIEKDLNSSYLRIDKSTNMLKWCVANIKKINGGIDLTDYYNKGEIDTKIDGLQNNINTNYNEFIDENTKTNEKITTTKDEFAKEIEKLREEFNLGVGSNNYERISNSYDANNWYKLSEKETTYFSEQETKDLISGKKLLHFTLYKVVGMIANDCIWTIINKYATDLGKVYEQVYFVELEDTKSYYVRVVLDLNNETRGVLRITLNDSKKGYINYNYNLIDTVANKIKASDIDLSDYYNKSETDNKLSTLENNIRITISNEYYDKSYITNNIYTKSTIDSKLRDYITNNKFNLIIQDYTTKSMVDNRLRDYYSKQEIDNKFANLPSGGGSDILNPFKKINLANKSELMGGDESVISMGGNEWDEFLQGKKGIAYRIYADPLGDRVLRMVVREGIIIGTSFYPQYILLRIPVLDATAGEFEITIDSSKKTMKVIAKQVSGWNFEWEYTNI